MDYTPLTEPHICSELTGNDAVFVQQEETSFTESPKGESSEWTDEKHSLYLKSMEASFVDKLYNSLDTQCPSGQFKVLQHGFWSRVDFRRENLAHTEQNRPSVSSSNPWIQHFRNRNRHAPIKAPSPQEKPALTSSSNTEVMDQNFDEEDSAIELMNTACSKKRKGTHDVSDSGNYKAAASFGHFSCNNNH